MLGLLLQHRQICIESSFIQMRKVFIITRASISSNSFVLPFSMAEDKGGKKITQIISNQLRPFFLNLFLPCK